MAQVDKQKIVAEVEACKDKVISFLRDLIAIPSPSCKEADVVDRIIIEMEALNFDEAFIDRFGNVVGRIGSGPKQLVYDSHIDTVGIGDIDSWSYDPYIGKVENETVFGRGASDNKAAIATMVYGAKIWKELALPDDVSLYVVGSVMEEDCDGLALGECLRETIPGVDAVVMGECTDLDIYRGHRGRMEIQVDVGGVSCHASAPERGENAIYKMSKIIQEIEKLNETGLKNDPFLGKGTIAVTQIECLSGSLNCVPDKCTIFIDRRTTIGEDKEHCLQQIKDLPGAEGAEVTLLDYEAKSHNDTPMFQEKYFPTWSLPEDHPLVQAGLNAGKAVLKRGPVASKWVFSTNGVSSMGRLDIPTIGFGPSEEKWAHTTEDQVTIEHLTEAVTFYAAFPAFFLEK